MEKFREQAQRKTRHEIGDTRHRGGGRTAAAAHVIHAQKATPNSSITLPDSRSYVLLVLCCYYYFCTILHHSTECVCK